MHFRTDNLIGILLLITIAVVIRVVKCEDKWIWPQERSKSGGHDESNGGDNKVGGGIAKPILKEVDDLIESTKRDQKESASSQVKRIFNEVDDYDGRRDIKRARYEVSEDDDLLLHDGRPSYNRRPAILPPPPNAYGPRPYPPSDEYGSQSAINSIRRQQPAAAGSSPLGILTGPVPSWERPILHKNGDPTSFQRCRCSFSFNCKSPGIHFGSCDQGKEYCCYNDVSGAESRIGTGTPAPSIDRYDRGPPSVLVGPDGPLDNLPVGLRPREPVPPFRQPTIHQSSYGVADGIGLPEYENRPPVPLPQKPVLPPYIGLHNDYRSS